MSGPNYAVLGPPGFVRDSDRFDDATLLRILGQNSGNLVFQYAASTLFGAPLTHFALSETPYDDAAALARAKVLIFPAANHLRPGADWSGLNDFLEQANKPLVVLGLGAQAAGLGDGATLVAALRADADVMRMVDILRRRAVFISVRGPFTKGITDALGLEGTHVLGCPSALINPDPRLGADLAAALDGLRARTGSGDILPAIAAAAPFEVSGDPVKRALERKLFEWAVAHQGRYVQQSGGLAAIRACDGRGDALDDGPRRSLQAVLAPGMEPAVFWRYLARHGRFFTDLRAWAKDLGRVDLVLGTRIHGVMAALAAGRPGVLIAHDSRTGELAETMHLPRVTISDVMAATSIAEVLDHVLFDARAFDLWRADVAERLSVALERHGLAAGPALRALASPALSRIPEGV